MKIEDVSNIWEKIKKLSIKKKDRLVKEDQWSFFDGIIFTLQEFTKSGGGALYLLKDGDNERKELVLEIFHHEKFDYISNPLAKFSSMALDENRDPLNTILFQQNSDYKKNKNPFLYSFLNNEILNIEDMYGDKKFDFSELIKLDQTISYKTKNILIVPVKNHFGENIGVLILFNSKNSEGIIRNYNKSEISYIELFTSLLGMAYTNYKLTSDLERMFESFVTVLANAIDEKSSHTGHHCRQVPILASMLAEATHEIDYGPLKDFQLNESNRYQLELAALLHDCGKITTPVHVMDKATKLQTIYDRIDLVNTRFEIIMRDIEIKYLREKAKRAKSDHKKLKGEYQKIIDICREDRKFLKECNIGREFMDEKMVERVHEISKKYSWKNSQGEAVQFLTEDEIHNLTVIRGTLTKEERDIINLHALTTINMLEKIYFPPHLKRIPEMAVNHHERMDGKGYPRGLKREEMSIEARLLGVVDVFEALTAKDRPYKKGKKLSEALMLMGRMKENNHIDPDLFDVFIDKQVYLQYAKKYLDPDQIDEIDFSKIPSYVIPEKREIKKAA